MRQAETVEHVSNRRERLYLDPLLCKPGSDLAQGDALLAPDHLPQGIGMRLKQRTTRAADLGWCGAAGLAHPLHQLHGGRRAHREALRRLPG